MLHDVFGMTFEEIAPIVERSPAAARPGLRADGGAARGISRAVRGNQEFAAQAAMFSQSALSNQIVLVNGNVGVGSPPRMSACSP